jgi:hypothetical protein
MTVVLCQSSRESAAEHGIPGFVIALTVGQIPKRIILGIRSFNKEQKSKSTYALPAYDGTRSLSSACGSALTS